MRSAAITLALAGLAIPAEADETAAVSPTQLLHEACVATRAEPRAVADLARARGWRRVPVTTPDGARSRGSRAYEAPGAQIMVTASGATAASRPVCTVIFQNEPTNDWREDFEVLAGTLEYAGPFVLPTADGETKAWAGPDGESLSYTVYPPAQRLLLLTFSGSEVR